MRTTIVHSKGENKMGVSLRPTAKSLLLGSALTMLVAGPFANAKAGNISEVSQRVSQYIYQGESLDVIKELNLKQSLRQGDQVLSISVKAQATELRSGLKLVVNGQVQERVKLSDQLQVISFQMPMSANIQSLELAGKAVFVKKITAQIEEYSAPIPDIGNNRGVIKVQLHQTVMAGDVLKIRKLVKQHTGQMLRGKQIEKIVLRGQVLTRGIKVQLIVDGMAVGIPQRLRAYEGNKLVLQVPSHISTKEGQIQVQILRGQMQVKMLKVKLGQSNSNQNIIVANVFKRTMNGEALSLISLLASSNARINAHAEVESIKVIASGRGSLQIQSGYNHAGSLRVMGPQSIDQVQLYGMNNKLGKIKLEVQGRMIIEQVIVTLKSDRRSRWDY